VQLLLGDPEHTGPLATFLQSVGHEARVRTPAVLEVDAPADELEAYLGVWRVLHPEVEVVMER
jgi:hypothetical protein